MSEILHIPEELLDAILLDLPVSAMASLSKTCRSLRGSVYPRMYRDVVMVWDSSLPDSSAPRIASLLRVLVAQPAVAANIERLELRAQNFLPYSLRIGEPATKPSNPEQYRLAGTEKGAFKLALEQMALSNVNFWLKALFNRNDVRAMMAILLMHCTSLKRLTVDAELTLDTEWFLGDVWLAAVLEHCLIGKGSSDRTARFQDLHSVTLPAPAKRDAQDTDYLCANTTVPDNVANLLLHLPRLAMLDIARSKSFGPFKEGGRVTCCTAPAVAANLTIMCLSYTNAKPKILKALLKVTPALKSLVYDHVMFASDFEGGKLADALTEAPTGLEALTLRVHMYQNHAMDLTSLGLPLSSSIRSLRHLHSLRSLTVPLALLLGNDPDAFNGVPKLEDMLPSSLENLTLVNDFGAFEDTVMTDDTSEAVLRAFLAGQKRLDKPWYHNICWECNPECEAEWGPNREPEWIAATPHLKRLEIRDEDDWGGAGGTILSEKGLKTLRDILLSQGLEVVGH